MMHLHKVDGISRQRSISTTETMGLKPTQVKPIVLAETRDAARRA